MYSKKQLGLAVVLAALTTGSSAWALEFEYANITGAQISFPGDGTFNFDPTSGANFQITSPGSTLGFQGLLSGTFSIGDITTDINTGISSAPVTGIGSISISDGVNSLTGSLTWINIVQVGVGGVLNSSGTANLSGLTYTGTNSDLLELAAAGTGSNVLTFQFVPGVSLAELKAAPANHTSFSGSIVASVPDGGSTLVLAGIGLTALGLVRRKVA